ncbi:MAG TPA: MarR family transcriptional regulator [Mycobacteriales bacterium]|nr:MarR family transcriptional regulator [Mycobacteriales bacterium]
MTTPNWLTPREARAWRGYLRMRDLLDLQISRDLAESSGLSTADYSVLAALSLADNQRLRLIDLAQTLLWSKSRLAHHLDRMAARGLIRRQSHPTNSRAAVITLTGQGRRTIEQAAPDHVASVRRHFIDRLTDSQLDALGDASEAVIPHLAELIDPGRTTGR